MRRLLTPVAAAIFSVVIIGTWIVLRLLIDEVKIADTVAWSLLYLNGLVWVIIVVERAARRIEQRRAISSFPHVQHQRIDPLAAGAAKPTWNPFDPTARYYGFSLSFMIALNAGLMALPGFLLHESPDRILLIDETIRPSKEVAQFLVDTAVPLAVLAMMCLAAALSDSKRLRQSLIVLTSYTILFVLLYILVHLSFKKGDENEYDLPAGGGSDSIKPTSVKVKKIVKRKFVINPYSSIVFAAPPPLDQIDVKLTEETANQYKAGQGAGGLGKGQGKGGGFGSGKGTGKYQLVRLRHSDRMWNKNLGVGGDYNLLAELKAREPLVQIAEETTSVDYTSIANMSAKKPLPLIYVGGTQTFAPTPAEKKILREYLTEKHGMILGDTLGAAGFHNNFINAMNEITGVTPVAIARDDRIHSSPYQLPQLPIVVAHGGTTPIGWKIDGRWAVYYHPGALSDAWRDDHAGIRKEIWELCYQLGINILYYAYVEQDSWRQAQQP